MGDSILDEEVVLRQGFGFAGDGVTHGYETGKTVREWLALTDEEREAIEDEAFEDARQYIEVYAKTENGYDLPE